MDGGSTDEIASVVKDYTGREVMSSTVPVKPLPLSSQRGFQSLERDCRAEWAS
jgi:hypothetical protein